MQLLDLPLDCFRYILSFIARDFDLQEHLSEFLSLRLINRSMDVEVLRTLQTPSFFTWKRSVRTLETTAFFNRVKGSVPSSKERLPLSSSYPDFIASFLSVRPNLQDPWNANISSVFNHVVDALLSADGLDVNDESRKIILRAVCRQVFEMKRWKENPGWFSSVLFPKPHPKFPDETESLDFNVLLAQVVLGRHVTLVDEDIPAMMARKSNVFGTLLEAGIKSGQVDLITSLLDTGVNVNDESLQVLETAVECGNPDILRLVFSSRYNLSRSVSQASRIEKAIQQAINNDQTESALFLLRTCDLSAISEDITFAFGKACCHNNLAIVKVLADELKVVDFSAVAARSKWISQHVIFYGHQDILRFLMNRGIKCDDESMMLAAVCSGDISMARYLLHDCGLYLSARTLCKILRVAVVHATPRHCAFVEAMFSDPSMFEKQNLSIKTLFKGPSADYADLFIYACFYGNVFIVRKIAEAGADLDHVEGYDEPPVLAALVAGQPAVVDVLVQMGAKLIDPMETELKERFENGELPEAWTKRVVNVDSCDKWWSQ